MGRIPDEIIDAVREAADIVEIVGARVPLRQAGRTFKGVCPFHGDKDPSLVVNRERGTWHCFGCGLGGNVFSFLMRDQGLEFPEAVRELAGRYGIRVPEGRLSEKQRREYDKNEKLLRVLTLAGKFFEERLRGPDGAEARDYVFGRRRLSPETAREFGLGFAPKGWENLRGHLLSQGVPEDLAIESGLLAASDRGRGSYDRFRNRVVFPIGDARGRVVSFGGRALAEGEAKYLNGPESPVFHKSGALYNLDRARRQMHQKGRALVVEGYFDVITMAAFGFGETVAPMGTALTAQQVRLLGRGGINIVLLFDGDEAGRKAARRALPVFLAEGVHPLVYLLPGGEDPDSFLLARGAEAMERALSEARPLVGAVLEQIIVGGDNSSPEGKSKIVAEAGEVIKSIKDPVASWGYVEDVAMRLDLPLRVVAARLGLPMGPSKAPAAAPAPKPPRTGGKGERALLEAALASPNAARYLVACGLLESLRDARLCAVGRAIADELDRTGSVDAGAVIQRLEDPELHPLVSSLASTGLRLEPETAERQAESLAHQLRARRLRREQDMLKRAIAQAERDGDHHEVDRLLAQRRRLMEKQLPLSTEKG